MTIPNNTPENTPNNATNTTIDIEALMYALAQQENSLPEELQRSLQAVSPSLRDNDPSAFQKLRELIGQYPPLNDSYLRALAAWDANYAAQERSKSLSQTFPHTTGFGLIFATDIAPSEDWVQDVQRLAQQRQRGMAKVSAWENFDRIAIMAAGGAFLGGAIVQLFGGNASQLLGALLGAIVGCMAGFYVAPKTTPSNRNP